MLTRGDFQCRGNAALPSFTTVSLKFKALIYDKNSAIMRLIVRPASTFMVGSGPDLFKGVWVIGVAAPSCWFTSPLIVVLMVWPWG